MEPARTAKPAIGKGSNSPGYGVSEVAFITSAKAGATQRSAEDKVFPASFETPMILKFGPRAVPFARVLRELEAELGVSVRLSSDIEVSSSSTPTGPPGQAANSVLTSASLLARMPDIEINAVAPRKEILRMVASKVGLEADFIDGEVVLSRLLTRNFLLEGSPRGLASSDTLAAQSNGTGSAGSSTQSGASSSNQTLDGTIKAFDELEAQLNAIKTSQGKVVLSRAANSVMIRDTRAVVEAATSIVDLHNSLVSRRVQLDVDVYSLKSTQTQSQGFDLQLAFQKYSNGLADVSIRFGNLTSSVGNGDAGSMIFSVQPNNAPGTNPRPFSGSRLIADALRAYGDVSTVYSGHGLVRNNMPLVLENVTEKPYISAITASAGGSGSGSTGTPGIVQSLITTGFFSKIYPTIVRGGVLIDGVMTLSALNSLDSASSGGQTVQQPNVTRMRSFTATTLPSGAYSVSQSNEVDLGTSRNSVNLLGWQNSKERTVERFIVVMRASILEAD